MLPIKAFSPRGKGPFSRGMTLEGGGGGIPIVSDVYNAVSDTLASIDPGPAIGAAGASIDKAVNDAVPGGWITVGGLMLGGAGLAFAPEIMAALAAEGVGGEAAFMAADAANLASQGLSQAAIAQNLAAGYGISEATAAAAASAAAASVAENGVAAVTQALPYSETYDAYNLASQGLNSQAITQNLVGSGVDPFLAQDMAQLASQGLSPSAINQALQYSYSAAELEPLGLESLQATPGTNTVFDTVKQVKNAYDAYSKANQLKNLITGSTLSGLTAKAGTTLPTRSSGLDLNGTTTGSNQQQPLDLTANITKGNTDFSLGPEVPAAAAPAVAGAPTITQPSYAPTQYGMAPGTFAAGGTTTNTQSAAFDKSMASEFGDLSPNITRGNINFHLPGYEKARIFAEGGEVEDHNPQFYSEGGLKSIENRYVKGPGDGTSDEVPAMLANGEFVIPADVVSKLGNGSNDAGAEVLDEFLATIREHAQRHDPKNLPPTSKGPLAYLLEAKKKA
jgi:hypothetical protein